MRSLRILDAFCCQGGMGVGLYRAARAAGYAVEMVGVDLNPQPRYPFTFVRADAIEYIRANGASFDLLHASPPCQRYSHGTVANGYADRHPDLIAPTRAALESAGRPYVIENVPRAPLEEPIMLCGSMFDLTATDLDGSLVRLERHRLFESNVPLSAPGPCRHDSTIRVAGSYGGARRDKEEARLIRKGGYVPAATVQSALLGIDWMSEAGLYQSIPPAYGQHVGAQMIAALEGNLRRDRQLLLDL